MTPVAHVGLWDGEQTDIPRCAASQIGAQGRANTCTRPPAATIYWRASTRLSGVARANQAVE